MANNSLTIHTNRFFGSFLKSPIQMGWLSIINSVTNISRLGTFKGRPQKRTSSTSEHDNSSLFSMFVGLFLPSWIRIRIQQLKLLRIRIYNPACYSRYRYPLGFKHRYLFQYCMVPQADIPSVDIFF